MAKFTGVYIDGDFLKNDAGELTTIQLGILLKLFDLMNQNIDGSKWGYLVDSKGSPLSERKIRYYCGGGSIISYTTWDTARKVFFNLGILSIIIEKGNEYIFSKPFIEMNPFTGEKPLRSLSLPETPIYTAEYFLGYDPVDNRPDEELTEWERICRCWIKLTSSEKGMKPPFPASWHIESKESAKNEVLRQVKEIGIKQAINDMETTFLIKRGGGGNISTMTFFTARWMAKDWKRLRPIKSKVESNPLKDEILILIKKGTIKTKTQLYKRYPKVGREIINKLIEGIKLHE